MRLKNKKLLYVVGIFLVLDFGLGSLLGWFFNDVFSGIYLGLIFALLLVAPFWGAPILIFASTLDKVEVFSLRPYHWVFLFWLLALALSFLVGRFLLKKKIWWSWEEVVKFWMQKKFWILGTAFLLLFSILGTFNAPDKLFVAKQNVILFLALGTALAISFWIGGKRRRLLTAFDALIYSSIPVVLFSIYQNIAHEIGWVSFEEMAARPNAFFYEPDWLGIYLVLVLVVLMGRLLLRLKLSWRLTYTAIAFLNILVLVISVARSSWLAAVGAWLILIFFGGLAFLLKRIKWPFFKRVLIMALLYLALLVLALGAIRVFKLSRFNLWDRVTSIYTGEHIITVAQKDGERFKIDLEEVNYYRDRGYAILEENVEDENVEARFTAYSTNTELVKEHWLLGQGQGSVLLRRDLVHNANNIFFEWWIAAGLGGLLTFIALLLGFLALPINYLKKGGKRRVFALSAVALMGLGVIFLVNLFNSGILFLPMWIFFALVYGSYKRLKK